jgi:pantetheine-phosphate adenylyltransferase
MRIVVTGNIGSGKSTAVKMLMPLLPGYTLFDFDQAVADLYNDPTTQMTLDVIFGTHIKSEISDIGHGDPAKMAQLENVVNTILVGVVAGSFDPITVGHMAMLNQARRLVDELHIVVGVNSAKTPMFSVQERQVMIAMCGFGDCNITFVEDMLLADFAASVKATHLIRGIRNAADYQYEYENQLINQKIQPQIETVFVISPRELTEVSSSVVKGFTRFQGWERIVKDYVHPYVLDKLKEKVGQK